MVFDWDWRTARWHFTRAVALEPGHSTTHQWFAYMLSAIGSHPDAIDEARRGVAADPLSLNSNTALGYVLYLARRYDEAAAQLSRTLEIDPDFAPARRNLAFVHVQQGRFAEAVNGLQRVAALDDGSPVACAELAWAQAVAGDSASARAALARLDRLRGTTYVLTRQSGTGVYGPRRDRRGYRVASTGLDPPHRRPGAFARRARMGSSSARRPIARIDCDHPHRPRLTSRLGGVDILES